VVDAGLWRVTDRRTTLADCLGRLPASEAWGLLAWLWTRDLITVDDLEAQITDRKHLYGIVRLRRMLAAVRRGAVSPAEIELQDFLTNRGFEGWIGDQKIIVRGRIIARADILFVAERVIIEFDGELAHPESASATDQARDKRLDDLGYHVIRVRWERLIHEPRDLVNEIRVALAARAA
jgi:very-short-patch-repair endonuclease